MSIYRFVTKKKLIGSNIIPKTSNIAYFNPLSRRFCVVNESLNSPENSDNDQDPFQSLAQKSLLKDDNIQTNLESVNAHRQERYQQRLQRKVAKGAAYDTYPEIFRQINNAETGAQIKQIVVDSINAENVPNDSFSHLQAIERIAKFLEPDVDDSQQDELDDSEIEQKTQRSTLRKPAIFTHAIRACFNLNQHKYGWELYELAREQNYISNDLYSLVLFGKLHENPSNESLTACFDIFDGWKADEKHGGLYINAKIYTSLIAQCLKVRNFGKAFHVYNNLMVKELDADEFGRIIRSPSVRQEIVNLYVKSQGVESAIRFVSDCKVKYGVLPTQNILCTLITGCGHEINKNAGFLEIAEKLFAAAFDVIQTEDDSDPQKMGTRIFSSLLQVYSKIGDYQSCVDLLNQMCDNESWPKPDKFCIAPAFKSIVNHSLKKRYEGNEDNKLSTEQKWELVDKIIEIQKKSDLQHDVITYCIMINLCDGNREKITQLYHDMMEKEKLTPNRMVLQNVLLGGLDGFYNEIKLESEEEEREENDMDIIEMKKKDKEITEFIDWILSEMNKYNLSVSENFRIKLKSKLDKIKQLQ